MPRLTLRPLNERAEGTCVDNQSMRSECCCECAAVRGEGYSPGGLITCAEAEFAELSACVSDRVDLALAYYLQSATAALK